MQDENLKQLSTAAFHANSVFSKLYLDSVTSAGIIGAGVVIDCALSQQRLVLMHNGTDVMAGIGKKATGDVEMLDQFPLDKNAPSAIIKLMEKRFQLRR